MNIFQTVILAFAVGGIGIAVGILLLYLFNIKSKRVIGMLFGITSGIMIAMICFDILPEALEGGEDLLVMIGIIIGILMGISLEDITSLIESKVGHVHSKQLHTGLVLLLGIAIHNIPEGIAMGTLAVTSPHNILKFAFVLFLHSIPEAIAIAIPLKVSKTSYKILAFIPVFFGGILGVGAGIGFMMSQAASLFITVMLGMAAGVILYIVCEELIPESRKIWNGRLTTVATIIGIILGMLLVR